MNAQQLNIYSYGKNYQSLERGILINIFVLEYVQQSIIKAKYTK
jgi:hypothetical protein